MTFPEAVEAQGRRQTWLAEQIGVSPSHVTRVMNGQRIPGPDFRRKAAAALGVPEAELFPEVADATPA